MLASRPVRLAGERVGAPVPALAAAVLAFCALFFAGGLSNAPLVWIGGLALVAGAALLFWFTPAGAAAAVFLGCLGGLAVWSGLTMVWSASPDASWAFTNRTLAYAGFGLLGVLVGGGRSDRAAAAATTLVSLLLGWALLAKCVPALYSDYGRVARLRAPLDDWNMLALVCVAAVPLALWLGSRARVASAVLLYLAAVALLLTYSRFGVALACVTAAAWIVLEHDRVESIVACMLAGGVGAGVFGIGLTLSGITSDEQSRATRLHDGWIFLLVLLVGAAVVALVALALLRIPPPTVERRRVVERVAAAAALLLVLAGLAVTIAKAGTIWHEFANPAANQTVNTSTHLLQAGSSNRWSWWQEAWHGFTAHPLGGTGAGTFRFTDLRLRHTSDVTALEPHNTPLQFLSETGIVGFLLYLGVAAAALTAAWRRRGGATTALGLVVAAFFAHTIVNYDWSFLAVCGPFLLLAGVLVSRPAIARVRRPLVAAAAVVFALGCVYSLAAPWLADRIVPTSVADLKRAHSYDPLSTTVLTRWAFFEGGNRGVKLFRDALALEPTNASVWYDLASYYAGSNDWDNAYFALSKAYEYDRYGLAGRTCGLAAEIRHKAIGTKPGPAICPTAGSPSSP
jgi:hypothetical protein